MNEDQIKYMVDRFLGWRLPKDFSPDAGISYTRPNYAPSVDATPTGTNLLEAAEYQGAVQDLEASYKAGVEAFAKWFAREYQMTREQWVKQFQEPPPEGDWFEGWNSGVDSVMEALDIFFGDFHP